MAIDPSSPLVRHAATIRDQAQVIGSALEPYLISQEERPEIAEALLRLTLAAERLLDLVSPSAHAMAGFAGNLPPEAFGDERAQLSFRNSDGWDFSPWMHEKTTRIRDGARRLAEYWLQEPRAVVLRLDAPMAPREWLREGLLSSLAEVKANAAKVFGSLFDDHVMVEDTRKTAPQTNDRAAEDRHTLPTIRPLDDATVEMIKIGLDRTAWTRDSSAWQAGTFPETQERMSGALRGDLPPIRILNVRVHHGADVFITRGRYEARLWMIWNPISYDTFDRGLRDPIASEVASKLLGWAAANRDLLPLTHAFSTEMPTIAVFLDESAYTSTLDELMDRLCEANDRLNARAEEARSAYIAELEVLTAHLPPSP